MTKQWEPKVYQHATCLPMVIYNGKPSRIVATRYGNFFKERNIYGRYYDLDVFDGGIIYRVCDIHESQTKLPSKEPQESTISVSQGMSAIPIRLVKA